MEFLVAFPYSGVDDYLLARREVTQSQVIKCLQQPAERGRVGGAPTPVLPFSGVPVTWLQVIGGYTVCREFVNSKMYESWSFLLPCADNSKPFQ